MAIQQSAKVINYIVDNQIQNKGILFKLLNLSRWRFLQSFQSNYQIFYQFLSHNKISNRLHNKLAPQLNHQSFLIFILIPNYNKIFVRFLLISMQQQFDQSLIVNLLFQTYNSSDTTQIKIIEQTLFSFSNLIQVPKCIHTILTRQDIDNNMKHAAANYLAKFTFRKFKVNQREPTITNTYLGIMNKIIEDQKVLGRFKQPVIKSWFNLSLELNGYNSAVYTKLAGSVSYYCRTKRTALGAMMINILMVLKQPGKKLINTINRQINRKMQMYKKSEIYHKFLGDCIESVNYQLKKVLSGFQGQIEMDGFTNAEQLIFGWDTISNLLTQFDFNKYTTEIPLLFKNPQLMELLNLVIDSQMFDQNSFQKIKRNAFRVLTNLVIGFRKMNLFTVYPDVSKSIAAIAIQQYAKQVELHKSTNLSDSFTSFLLEMMKSSDYIQNNNVRVEINYFIEVFIKPIIYLFNGQFHRIIRSNDFDEFERFIGFLRYPQHARKGIEEFAIEGELFEHPQFYNLACLLGSILKKVPSAYKLMGQLLILLMSPDHSLLSSFSITPENLSYLQNHNKQEIGLLISVLLVENLYLSDQVVSVLQMYFMNSYEPLLSGILTKTQLTQEQLRYSFLLLMNYQVYADQFLVKYLPREHQMIQLFLKTAYVTKYFPIFLGCLECIIAYLQQKYPFDIEKQRITQCIQEIPSILLSHQFQRNFNFFPYIHKLTSIYLLIVENYYQYFDVVGVMKCIINLIDIIDIQDSLVIIEKILFPLPSAEVSSIIFNQLIPKIMKIANTQEATQSYIEKCCDIIVKGCNCEALITETAHVRQITIHSLSGLILDDQFPGNHSQKNNIYLYRLFWLLERNAKGPQQSQLLQILLSKCLYYLEIVDSPYFRVDNFIGDNPNSVVCFHLMVNWIILNHPELITEHHVESILKILLKYTDEIIKDLLQKNKSYIFMIGKAHLMVVILYLKVPDLIISVMNTRPWNINTSHKFFSLDCTTFEESVSYIIFNSSYFYDIEYDIPILVTEILYKFRSVIEQPHLSNQYCMRRYSHLYWKICIECIEKIYVRNTYNDHKVPLPKKQFKNLTIDGLYENYVSESEDEENCEQGITMIEFVICYKEVTKIYKKMNLFACYPQKSYDKFISNFISFYDELSEKKHKWFHKVYQMFIQNDTKLAINKLKHIECWNDNEIRSTKKNRVYFKIKK